MAAAASKTNNKKRSRQAKNASDNNKAAEDNNKKEEEETLWDVFFNHPLVMLAPFVLVPAIAYQVMFVVLLQHPEWWKGLADLRPATRITDKRQVLLLAPMASGAQEWASRMTAKPFGLEIPYERTDCESYFCRDGTVSSALAVRYYQPGGEQDGLHHHHDVQSVVQDMCMKELKGSAKSGFEAKYYQPRTKCSYLKTWYDKNCPIVECLEWLQQEWGCAMNDEKGCRFEFARVLHLVQHPLHTLSELEAKVCPASRKNKNHQAPHPVFMQLATAFVPSNKDALSCLETISWYLVNFHRTLLNARKADPSLIYQVVQMEKTSTEELIRLGGFCDDDLMVYPGNRQYLTQACDQVPEGEDEFGNKKQQNTGGAIIVTKTTDETRVLYNFTWTELEEIGGPKLVTAMKQVCDELGYDCDSPTATEKEEPEKEKADTNSEEKAADEEEPKEQHTVDEATISEEEEESARQAHEEEDDEQPPEETTQQAVEEAGAGEESEAKDEL